jgi:hypothetical protein
VTQPVPNTQSAIVTVTDSTGNTIGTGKLIPPWNSFFQQFTQAAPAAVVATSPYTPNARGTLILNAAVSATLTRGSASFVFTTVRVFPVSIGDTLTWSGTTAMFLGD